MASLYDTDFCQWLRSQADLLRQRQFDALDVDNLVEETESLERDQRIKIGSHIRALLELRILYDHVPQSPERDTWYADIVEQQVQIETRVDISPSLSQCLAAVIDKEWKRARTNAMRRMQVAYGIAGTVLSEACPYPVTALLPYLKNGTPDT